MTKPRPIHFRTLFLGERHVVVGDRVFADIAVLQQCLGSERFQIVAPAAAADLIQQIVRRLDVGVRVLVLEVVEDQASPTLLAHVGQHLPEGLLQFLREQLSPAIVGLLGFGSGLAQVDVVEPFLEQHRLLDCRMALEQGLQPELISETKTLRPSAQQANLVLELDPLVVVDLRLNALPNLRDREVSVSQDVEFIDYDGRALEVRLVQRLVGPVHVLGNDLDLHSVGVLPLPEVLLKVRLLSRNENVEQNPLLDVADDEAGVAAKHLLVHTHHARQFETVMAQSPCRFLLEDAADQALLHSVDLAAHGKLHADAVFGELVHKTRRHAFAIVDPRQVFEKDRVAVPTTVSLAGNAQVGLLALDRVISEVNHPLAVLHDVCVFTAPAPLDARVQEDRVDIQLPVQLFGLHGHVAFQPQQIIPNNAPHSPFPQKPREHEPVNSPCQIRELAA